MSGAIRVLLVEDQRILREGLRTILDLEPDIEVVGEAENGQRALDLAVALQPNVALMDLKMPIMDGVEATRRIVAACPHTRVVILTTYDHDNLVVEALRVCARGYLLKDDPADEMIRAIHLAHHGESLLQPAVAAKLLTALQEGLVQAPAGPAVALDHQAAHPEAPSLPLSRAPAGEAPAGWLVEPLTERELQVLALVASGASNLRIAEHLHLAQGTVKNHLSQIMDKLGAGNRTEAVAIARQRGLLP